MELHGEDMVLAHVARGLHLAPDHLEVHEVPFREYPDEEPGPAGPGAFAPPEEPVMAEAAAVAGLAR
jgi:hypothetical protein